MEKIEADFEFVSHKATYETKNPAEKAEELAERIEDFVAEELKGFFEEMRSARE